MAISIRQGKDIRKNLEEIFQELNFVPGKRIFVKPNLCEKLNVPVVFHTGENSGDSECAKWNDPKYIVEIAKDYPRLKIIISHYYWPKIDYCYEVTKGVSNIYFDLAAMADNEVVEKSGGIEKIKNVLKKTINDGQDKIIFGTDWLSSTHFLGR